MRGYTPFILATAIGLGVVFSCIPSTKEARLRLQPVTVKAITTPQSRVDLKQALHSTFIFKLAQNKFGGATCTLISRVKMEDGKYRYRGLTAYHVLDDYLDALRKDPKADNNVILVSLGWDKEFEFTTKIKSDWVLPIRDWATFTFVSQHYLSCAVVGTKENFNALDMTDDIYIVGNDASMGLMVRKTTIAAPTNRFPNHVILETKPSSIPWFTHPEDFFRIMSFIWYGCSGGGVYNDRGKLIGVINAMGIFGGHHNDPTGFPAIALKAHVIRDLVIESNPFFFLIED